MSPATMIDALACSIADAEAAFEAEKCELLNPAHCEAAIQARRKYLKSVEMRLAEMHDRRRQMASGLPGETGVVSPVLIGMTR